VRQTASITSASISLFFSVHTAAAVPMKTVYEPDGKLMRDRISIVTNERSTHRFKRGT
jgi:hypothetical protein